MWLPLVMMMVCCSLWMWSNDMLFCRKDPWINKNHFRWREMGWKMGGTKDLQIICANRTKHSAGQIHGHWQISKWIARRLIAGSFLWVNFFCSVWRLSLWRILTLLVRVVYLWNTLNYVCGISILMNFHPETEKKWKCEIKNVANNQFTIRSQFL